MREQKHKVALIFLVLTERLNSVMNLTVEILLTNKK